MTSEKPAAPQSRFMWSLWAGVVVLMATLLLAYLLAQVRYRRSLGPPLPVLGEVQNFTLTNQTGQVVTLDALRGHVWVADIIFTRCPGPCLKMTRQMKLIQDSIPPGSGTRLVSLTTDPDYDNPAILKAYGEKQGANFGNWSFLTGTKDEIRNLAVGSLKLTALEKTPNQQENPNDLFIHSTIFIIVDKPGRLRGVFDTTGPGVQPNEVTAQVIASMKRLNHEQ